MTEGTRVDEARVPAPREAPHLGGFGIRIVVAGDHDHRRARGKGGRVGKAQRAMLVPQPAKVGWRDQQRRSEEHTSELQSLMRNSSAGFCFTKKKTTHRHR